MGEILNRIIGRKNRIIGTALNENDTGQGAYHAVELTNALQPLDFEVFPKYIPSLKCITADYPATSEAANTLHLTAFEHSISPACVCVSRLSMSVYYSTLIRGAQPIYYIRRV